LGLRKARNFSGELEGHGPTSELTLAAELYAGALHSARSAAQDVASRIQAAGEADEVDVGVLGERRPHAGAAGGEELQGTRRHAGLEHEAHEMHRRQRRHLRRLDDAAVARGNRRRQLPADLQQRVCAPSGLSNLPAPGCEGKLATHSSTAR